MTLHDWQAGHKYWEDRAKTLETLLKRCLPNIKVLANMGNYQYDEYHNGLYEDMLWGYRTKRNVSDKVACLLSIIPLLVISNDKGHIVNVKNAYILPEVMGSDHAPVGIQLTF